MSYEQKVNSMLRLAERRTNSKIQRKDFQCESAYTNAWNKLFFENMDALTERYGRIKIKPKNV